MPQKKLKVQIISFSYKHGLPRLNAGHGGGFIFDCRGILNPGRESRFKNLNGKDKKVAAFLERLPEAKKFSKASLELVELTIKSYLARGFGELGVAFGCTGGQHRSVYFAEKLSKKLCSKSRVKVSLTHRDIPRESKHK